MAAHRCNMSSKGAVLPGHNDVRRAQPSSHMLWRIQKAHTFLYEPVNFGQRQDVFNFLNLLKNYSDKFIPAWLCLILLTIILKYSLHLTTAIMKQPAKVPLITYNQGWIHLFFF